MRQRGESYFGSPCNPSKVNPPGFYLYCFKSAPLLRCREARHHFKVIFPMSNFTVGYARLEYIRAAIILNTCFSRYFSLSLCASILRWWTANEQTGRCIWVRSYELFAEAPSFSPYYFASPQLEGRWVTFPVMLMGDKWATTSSVSDHLRQHKRSLPSIRRLFDWHCRGQTQANEL